MSSAETIMLAVKDSSIPSPARQKSAVSTAVSSPVLAGLRASLAEPVHLNVWILLIARSLAIDLLRRRTQETRSLSFGPSRSEVSEEPGPEWYAEHRDLIQRARKAMDRLPSGQRSAVELAYLGQRSSTQVAELQDIPLGTVKSRIRVGIATLRKTLLEGDDAA
jgi:RNA polymerase sigma-70 factor (ECF subfamily)